MDTQAVLLVLGKREASRRASTPTRHIRTDPPAHAQEKNAPVRPVGIWIHRHGYALAYGGRWLMVVALTIMPTGSGTGCSEDNTSTGVMVAGKNGAVARTLRGDLGTARDIYSARGARPPHASRPPGSGEICTFLIFLKPFLLFFFLYI